MQLRDRIVPKSISSNYPDISELILRMTDPIVANRISLDQLARVVDELLDDEDVSSIYSCFILMNILIMLL